MDVGVVLFEVEVALMVEHVVEHEGRVAVGVLDRSAVERCVVVGDEGVELESSMSMPVSEGQFWTVARCGGGAGDVRLLAKIT